MSCGFLVGAGRWGFGGGWGEDDSPEDEVVSGIVVVLRCGVRGYGLEVGVLWRRLGELLEREDYEVGDPLFGWLCQEGLGHGIGHEYGVFVGCRELENGGCGIKHLLFFEGEMASGGE